jgi:hypothetical protein
VQHRDRTIRFRAGEEASILRTTMDGETGAALAAFLKLQAAPFMGTDEVVE